MIARALGTGSTGAEGQEVSGQLSFLFAFQTSLISLTCPYLSRNSRKFKNLQRQYCGPQYTNNWVVLTVNFEDKIKRGEGWCSCVSSLARRIFKSHQMGPITPITNSFCSVQTCHRFQK